MKNDAIILKPELLPDTVEKLNLFIQVGKEKLKAQEAKLKAVNKPGIEISKDVKDRILIETQQFAIALLYAEAKLGELLKGSSKGTFKKGGEHSLPPGIDKRTSHYAQQIHEHENLIKDIAQIALKRNDIPRRTDILKKIRKIDQAKKYDDILDYKKESRITDCQDIIKADVLITDPPYGILDKDWEPNDIEKFTTDWLSRWNECGADFILSFWSQKYLWYGKDWFDKNLNSYSFQQLLIWCYRNNKSPQSRMGYKQSWEPIFFYRRNGSERKIEISEKIWGKDIHDFDSHIAAVPQTNFSGVDSKEHPAQKPLSVMRWLVSATSKPGDLIVDPFCGTGTTGIAAIQLKRRFYGIEINLEIKKIAQKRLIKYGKS